MSYENWKDKAQGFQTVDVRHIQGSFFEAHAVILLSSLDKTRRDIHCRSPSPCDAQSQ